MWYKTWLCKLFFFWIKPLSSELPSVFLSRARVPPKIANMIFFVEIILKKKRREETEDEQRGRKGLLNKLQQQRLFLLTVFKINVLLVLLFLRKQRMLWTRLPIWRIWNFVISCCQLNFSYHFVRLYSIYSFYEKECSTVLW